jgi:hypothetical protein
LSWNQDGISGHWGRFEAVALRSAGNVTNITNGSFNVPI